MKLLRFLPLFLILFFLFNMISYTQTKNDIKSTMTNLINLSKAKKYEDAGKFIAYCADDKKKEYKAPLLSNKEQLNYVKRLIKRISALAEVSESFNISTTVEEKAGGIEYQNVTVEFLSGSQKISSVFRFVNLNGSFFLADID